MSNLSGQYLGRYQLTEFLGEGGMATVYKAYDTRLERNVAIKIIRSAVFPGGEVEAVLKRFEREAKSLAKLSHPNIVKVHDYGEHDGSPYLVMEYLPGGTLKKFIGKPLNWRNAIHLLLPVARGVAYAHQRGILHRDIKPANILLTESGEPMLSDFGIAKLFEGEQTTTLTGSGMAIGTPEYMAPEQWTGTTSIQSDLYSLGIILYEMVAGRKPYVADTPAGILIKQATEPLPGPRKFVADLPEELESILVKALAKEPDDRYPDLNAFIGALENLNTLAPVVSHRAEPRQAEETFKVSSPQPSASMETEVSPRKIEAASIRPSDKSESEKMAERSSPVAKASKLSTIRFPRKGFGFLVGAILILFALWLSLPVVGKWFSPVPVTPSPTATIKITASSIPASETPKAILATETFAPTYTTTVTAPQVSLPMEIQDAKGLSMKLVPAGEFTMGFPAEQANSFCQTLQKIPVGWTNPCNKENYLREEPVHKVMLKSFYIDTYEVSNGEYQKCAAEHICMPPAKTSANQYSNYYNNENLLKYPVLNVTWDMAKTYCEWRGARLPTEAEWEKAARGTDGRTYPWENYNPAYKLYDPSLYVNKANLNLSGYSRATMPVDSNPDGLSPYGLYNTSGNVWEWVADWYNEIYYASSPSENPPGPSRGEYKVIRGGGINTPDGRTTVRDYLLPTDFNIATGFRCAKDVTP